MFRIYLITNEVSGKKYVGKTSLSLRHRWYGHLYDAFIRQFPYPICNDLRKLGAESFSIKLIALSRHNKSALKLEQHFIGKLKTGFPRGYNTRFLRRCKRCGMVGSQNDKHKKGIWHRNAKRIRRWIANGVSFNAISKKLGVSRVRIGQSAWSAGFKKR